MNAADVNWVSDNSDTAAKDGPKVAFLWGGTEAGQLNGSYIKLPAHFSGSIHSRGTQFGAVVIKGQLTHAATDEPLAPGSYFSSKEATLHQVQTNESEVVLYVRANGKYDIAVE
ncbi:DUF4437 domain-containing protein [Coraliomargarita algicola]|uniref:DUF4437 domain-containing protein n=1 Tax=Coraliomargarita algicola TaxID=3092156 RepID=A0ABZ0RVY1_9BACT|nr:DUF4437 domain-containing protein [Coraliomargarita sp. J2-16]WPJ97144.1 DUF4437 domain-containing protein [Coraliomargarita sp. J2-16]